MNENERIADYIERLEQERDAATAALAVYRAALGEVHAAIEAADQKATRWSTDEESTSVYGMPAGPWHHLLCLARGGGLGYAALATPSPAADALLELAGALRECVEWLESRPEMDEGDAATSSRGRAALND